MRARSQASVHFWHRRVKFPSVFHIKDGSISHGLVTNQICYTHDAQTDRTLPIQTHSESAKKLGFLHNIWLDSSRMYVPRQIWPAWNFILFHSSSNYSWCVILSIFSLTLRTTQFNRFITPYFVPTRFRTKLVRNAAVTSPSLSRVLVAYLFGWLNVPCVS